MMKKNFHGIRRAQVAPKKATKTTKFPMPVQYIKYVKNNSFVWGLLYDNGKVRILRDACLVHIGLRYQYNDANKFCNKILTERDITSMGWQPTEFVPCF